MLNKTYTDTMRTVEDAVGSLSVQDLAIMAEVMEKSSRMTAGLIRKLRKAGEYIPPDVARWEMDRLADAPANYDPFKEIWLEYAGGGAIAD